MCRSPGWNRRASAGGRPGRYLQLTDIMVLLEAMKVETAVTAPVEGRLLVE